MNKQKGTDSNSEIQTVTSFCEVVCKFHTSAHFKYKTSFFTYLFVTNLTHKEGPLIQ